MPRTLLLALLLLLCLGQTPARGQALVPSVADKELQKKINHAIDQGVAYLKRAGWDGDGDNERGMRALVGWTLLESDVPPDDPAVQALARQVRAEMVRAGYTHTYSLSLAILFLDRLGAPADVPLIHSAAVRLLGGQNAAGGWTYHCSELPAEEEQRLTAYLQQAATVQEPPPAPEIIAQLKTILSRPPPAGTYGDNSNTQLAVMGLWAARRHNIPVVRAINLAALRFINSQFPNGGWSYLPPFCQNPDELNGDNREVVLATNRTMTAIGLYVLACHVGLTNTKTEHVDLLKFPNMRAGVQFLSLTFQRPEPMHRFERGCYYLFALEKTALVLDARLLGGKDWYGWGADTLVQRQQPDGAWAGPRGEDAGGDDGRWDTCFALLFLRRANPAPDLTANLKGIRQEPPRALPPMQLPVGMLDAHKLDQPLHDQPLQHASLPQKTVAPPPQAPAPPRPVVPAPPPPPPDSPAPRPSKPPPSVAAGETAGPEEVGASTSRLWWLLAAAVGALLVLGGLYLRRRSREMPR